jgi:AraC-like DNA-binding protein
VPIDFTLQAMVYKIYQPSLLVQQLVSHYHLLHFDFRNLSEVPRKLYYPHIEQCLTFDPLSRVVGTNIRTGTEQKRSYSYLSKQQTSAFDLRFAQQYMMLKVVFRPGALFRLLGVPLNEFGDNYLDAESIIPSDVRMVNEQLVNAPGYEEMIRIIEEFLIVKIRQINERKRPKDRLYHLFEVAPPVFSLDWLARQACLSARQVERKYQERIGVSPVVYHRIQRFNLALKVKETNPTLDWLSVALHCGYSDLQHLIKDFRQLSGAAPSALAYQEANSIHKKLGLG